MVWAVINEQIGKAIAEFADSPSDRVCAVVGSAIVEEGLLRALDARLRADDPSERTFFPKARFFSSSGAMGSFHAKIQLGYLLGMYDKAAVRALEGISGIRNQFAHRLSIVSFDADDKVLKDGLDNLKLHDIYKRYPHPLYDGDADVDVEAPAGMRERFIVNARILLVVFMRDHRLHLPYSNQFQPLPNAPAAKASLAPSADNQDRSPQSQD